LSTRSPGVTARYFILLAILATSLFSVAAVGTQELQGLGGAVSFLYTNTVLTAQSANDLTGSIADAHQAALAILATDDATLRQRLYINLVQRLVPDVDAKFAAIRAHLIATERAELSDLDKMRGDWRRFVALMATGQFTQSDAHLRSAATSEVSAALDRVTALGRDIAHLEADQARAANALAGHRRTWSLALMGVVLALADISAILAFVAGAARRRSEQAEAEELGVLRSQARFWSALADHGDDVIVVTDTHAQVLEVSESMGRVLGHTVHEVVGSALTDWVHPDDRASMGSVLERVASGPDGFVVRAEWRWRHGDGGWRDVETSVTNLLADPDVAGIVLNARDVTERRRLEEELRHGASIIH
jgi:PAS domain S-box-containing protein